MRQERHRVFGEGRRRDGEDKKRNAREEKRQKGEEGGERGKKGKKKINIFQEVPFKKSTGELHKEMYVILYIF